MAIGFNIEYKEDISDNLHNTDNLKIKKDWLNSEIINIAHSLSNNHVPTLCECEFWGNPKEGYDFNDIYSKDQIYSIDNFVEYWNLKTRKLFLKKNIKEAKRLRKV